MLAAEPLILCKPAQRPEFSASVLLQLRAVNSQGFCKTHSWRRDFYLVCLDRKNFHDYKNAFKRTGEKREQMLQSTSEGSPNVNKEIIYH